MRKTLLLVMALCSMVGAQASEISESEAAKIASEFVTSHGFSSTRGNAKLMLAKSSQGYYAYNRGANGGFVLVAADDNMGAQVLGYADSGTLDFSQLPCNLKWWLAQYDLMATTGASMPQASVTRANAKADIEPLITCKWNQDSPYNDLCPEYATGQRSVTGCVATATAQVMYYHKWPKIATGSNSYYWESGGKTLSMDFGGHAYDWAHMTDTYDANSTDEENNAVAELMRDCGYAMNMDYGEESGAEETNQVKALVKYFDYDRGIRLTMRSLYSYDEWHNMLYAELAAGRPMLTCGGVHAFVFDGYKQEDGMDWYHVNWGWGGVSDGYFLCSNLNPDDLGIGAGAGSYSNGLEAIVGIQPAIDGSATVPEVYSEIFTPTSVKQGNDAAITTQLLNYSVIDSVFTLGLKVVNDNTGEITKIKNATPTTISPFAQKDSFSFSLNGFPTVEGVTYSVYPIYYVGDTEYSFRIPTYESSFNKAEVKGDSIRFWDGENIELPTISDVTIESQVDTVYVGTTVNVSAVVKAVDNDYCDNLYMLLVKDPNNYDFEPDYDKAVAIDLRKGESVNAQFSLEAPAEIGTYHLIFVNTNGIAAKSDTTIYVAPLPEDELTWQSNIEIDPTTDFDPAKDVLKIKFSLTCATGYYKGFIFIFFTEEGATKSSAVIPLSDGLMVAGQSISNSAKIPAGYLSDLEYGKTYRVEFGYIENESEMKYIPSNATLTTAKSSGISSVTAGGELQTIKIYSLDGKLVTTQKAISPDLSTLPQGTYIIKVGDKVKKVLNR